MCTVQLLTSVPHPHDHSYFFISCLSKTNPSSAFKYIQNVFFLSFFVTLHPFFFLLFSLSNPKVPPILLVGRQAPPCCPAVSWWSEWYSWAQAQTLDQYGQPVNLLRWISLAYPLVLPNAAWRQPPLLEMSHTQEVLFFWRPWDGSSAPQGKSVVS